ncbi:hypothetical protein MTO96_028202 [Rhipicephalus appendiculatus]
MARVRDGADLRRDRDWLPRRLRTPRKRLGRKAEQSRSKSIYGRGRSEKQGGPTFAENRGNLSVDSGLEDEERTKESRCVPGDGAPLAGTTRLRRGGGRSYSSAMAKNVCRKERKARERFFIEAATKVSCGTEKAARLLEGGRRPVPEVGGSAAALVAGARTHPTWSTGARARSVAARKRRLREMAFQLVAWSLGRMKSLILASEYSGPAVQVYCSEGPIHQANIYNNWWIVAGAPLTEVYNM